MPTAARSAATDKSEQFTTSVNGMVVTVTPKENTTEQAITATLTIKLMKAGAAVDTKTVAISQAGKSVPGGSGYTRVNAVTAGKKYLIVAETGEKNYVFEAAQLAGGAGRPNGVEIAVSNSKIDSNTTNDAYAVTIEASGDGYVIKTADGKFVEYNGSSTTLKLSDTAGRIWIATAVQAKNTIKFTDKETMSASTVRCLLFQNTSAYQRFGGYAEQNADTSDYVTVALYELSE